MGKYKKLKEEYKKLNDVFDIVLHNQSMNCINMQTLENEIAKLKQPFLHYIKKIDYDSDKVWWNKRLDEMESKLTMKWYSNTGIYKRIREEIADQITQNMRDIAKLKEDVQNRQD